MYISFIDVLVILESEEGFLLTIFHISSSFFFILQLCDMVLQQQGVANFKEMGP